MTQAAGLRARARRRPARPDPLRAARRARRARPSRRSARMLLREALALWRGPPLADSELEDVRPGRDPPARGPAARRARGTDRGRPRAGVDAELVAELEALVARAPAARAAAGAADARALPLRPAGGRAQRVPRRAPHARRRARDRAGPGAPGAVRLDPAAGALARARRAARAARTTTTRCCARFSAGRLVPVLGPAPAASPAASWRSLLAERFELDAGGSRPRVHLAGGRRAERDRARSTTSCISRSTATSSRRRCTRGSPGCRRCFAARGLPQQLIVSTEPRHRRRARLRSGRRGARRRRLRRRRPRPRQVPPHRARRCRHASSTSRTPTPASRSRSAACC